MSLSDGPPVNSDIIWKPLTFTLVEYPKGDIIGYLLAWITLTPLIVGAGFMALILFRRDMHSITFFVGTILNECINKVLKHWFKEPRPIERNHIHTTDYGMPSSHSQFIWFFSFYIHLFVLIRLHHMNNNSPMERVVRLIVICTCYTIAVLVCYSRIYLMYHTCSQVLVGCLCGLAFGGVWFAFNQLVLTPYYPTIISWKLSEYILLRDTTLIPNILWFEYTTTRQEARTRARKLISKKSQ